MKLLDFAIQTTNKYIEEMPKSQRKKYGQFFTSKETAVFMAGLFGVPENKTRLQILDAGAGSGVLSIALIERLQEIPKLQYVHLVCYENDSKIIELLRKNLQWVRQHTTLSFDYEIREDNYILSQMLEYNEMICADPNPLKYDMVIGNPPYMKIAKENSKKWMDLEGGPFGAVIVNKEGEIISNGNNRVLKEKDPTQHAEIVAIREACKKLNTYDLSEYELYTSCEPCPMCLSAIIWANIKTVYYGCTKEDAGSIGFRDDKIYEFLKGENVDLIDLKQIDRKECFKEMENYKKNQGIIY